MISAPSTPQNSTLCLAFRGHGEVLEDDEEYKDVIDRQREFNQVPGRKLQRARLPDFKVEEYIKQRCQRDPDGGPRTGLFKADIFGAAVHYTQIQQPASPVRIR